MAETIKGLNIKLGLDTTDLDQKLKDINKELKEEQKDLRAINNSLKFDSSNLDKWREKQDKLNSILENTKTRLEVQNKRLEESKKALQVGAISQEQFNQVQRSVEYTSADINKLNLELKKTEDQINKIGGINTESLKKVGSNFTKYLTAPILGAATALSTLAYKATQTADDLADDASKVYLSVEAYQEWGYVAKMLAVDSNNLQKAFTRTNAILGEVTQGGEKYNETLSKLGISSDKLVGKSTDEAFEVLRSSLSKVEDQAERTALANELFGEKLGSELTQVLSSTSSEIENLRNQAKELGIVTTEQAETSGTFHDSLDNLKQSFTALSVEIGVQVIPALQKMVDVVQNNVVPAIRSLSNWWGDLSDTTKKIVVVLLGVLAAIGPVISIVLKLIPAIKTLKGVMAGGEIAKFFQGFSLGKATLVGLIATLAVILLQNEKFKETLSQLIETLGKVLEPIGNLITSLMDKLQPVISAIVEVINKVIEVLVKLIEGIMPALEAIIGLIVEVLSDVINIVLDLIDEILPVVISLINEVVKIIDALKPILEVVISLISTIISQALNLIEAILDPIIKILNVVIKIVGVIIGVVGNLINAILKPLNSILNVIAAVITTLVSILEVVINVLVSILEPALKIIFAVLEPILSILMVFIEIIASIMEMLSPLIDMLLSPLIAQLDFLAYIFEALAPLITMVGDILGSVLAPALEVVFKLLEPILWVLEKIIVAFKWVTDNVKRIFDGVSNALSSVGGFFGDLFTGKLFQNSSSNTTNNATTNHVTVNTSSSKFDINSINKALGGAY